MKGRRISAAKSQEDAWKLTRLEMEKRQKQGTRNRKQYWSYAVGVTGAGVDYAWASLVHQSMWYQHCHIFSLSVLPMELNVQDSAQLWYPTVPPFHRGASLCNPFLTTGTKWSLMQARTFLHVKLNALNHPTRTLDTTPAVRANKDVCSVVQLLNSFLHVCAYTLSPVWLFATHKLGPPDSSVYGICQARILERVAISCSRGSSQPWDWICISCASCIGKQILYHCTTCEAPFPSWELLKSSEPW